MDDFSYTQLVNSPTTAQATLLDHVYYKNPSVNSVEHVMIHVIDTYYSDHNTVYCNIPIAP